MNAGSSKRSFFTVRVTEPWNKLPRKEVEFPSPQIFKTHLDVSHCNVLQGTCLRENLDWMTLWFCDSAVCH